MTLIELTDKAVGAIRDRAKEVAESDGYYGGDDEKRAAEILAALDGRNGDDQVDFDDSALAWLEEDRKEIRHSVEDRLGLVDGLAVDWEGSTGDAHYVWAIGDIEERIALAAKIAAGEYGVECLEPQPVDGWKTIEDAAGISAELQRLEAWWDVIEEPPAGHPDWALRGEVDSWVDGWKSMYRKVLELIAEGKVDPTEAAKAALTDPRKAAA
jgi:hypothetical protein